MIAALERDAVGEPAGDADLHHALLARLGQQTVDADAVDAELLADLRLGEAGDEIEPGGARRELLVAIDGERTRVPRSWLSLTSRTGMGFSPIAMQTVPRNFERLHWRSAWRAARR